MLLVTRCCCRLYKQTANQWCGAGICWLSATCRSHWLSVMSASTLS